MQILSDSFRIKDSVWPLLLQTEYITFVQCSSVGKGGQDSRFERMYWLFQNFSYLEETLPYFLKKMKVSYKSLENKSGFLKHIYICIKDTDHFPPKANLGTVLNHPWRPISRQRSQNCLISQGGWMRRWKYGAMHTFSPQTLWSQWQMHWTRRLVMALLLRHQLMELPNPTTKNWMGQLSGFLPRGLRMTNNHVLKDLRPTAEVCTEENICNVIMTANTQIPLYL